MHDLDYYKQHFQEIEGACHIGAIEITELLNGVQRDSFSIKGDLAEIGVFKGRFFILLALLATEYEKLYGNDLHQFEEVNAHLLKYDTKCTPIVHYCDSLSFEYESECRFIHIDGAHDYKHTYGDLEKALESLVHGGIIIIDDIWHYLFPQISIAIYDLLDNYYPIAQGANKLWITNSEHHAQVYKNRLMTTEINCINKQEDYFGNMHNKCVYMQFNEWVEIR